MWRFISLAVAAAATLTLAAQAPAPRLDARTAIAYYIESGRGIRGYREADPELVADAFGAWSRESGGALTFTRVGAAPNATITIRWISAGDGLYGETERVTVNGKAGAVVNVMPDVSMQGEPLASLAQSDQLLRDAVVYLTCVHEIGHALGLQHSRDYADIMYYFGYGGDVVQYFERYRKPLRSRADISTHSGISGGDRRTIQQLYPRDQ